MSTYPVGSWTSLVGFWSNFSSYRVIIPDISESLEHSLGNAEDRLDPFVLSCLDLLSLKHRYFAPATETSPDGDEEASVILLDMAL